jgi:hypothetical protein
MVAPHAGPHASSLGSSDWESPPQEVAGGDVALGVLAGAGDEAGSPPPDVPLSRVVSSRLLFSAAAIAVV